MVTAVLQYGGKCSLLLQDTDTYPPLTINPLPNLTRIFNAIVKENIPSNLINVKKKFPYLTYFYGIHKVYNQGMPMLLCPAVVLFSGVIWGGAIAPPKKNLAPPTKRRGAKLSVKKKKI